MYFKHLFTPALSIHSYLIGDEKTKRCALIDPVRHVTPYILQTQNDDMEISVILETHVHADFVSGALELKNTLGGKPLIYCSGMGGKEWIPSYADSVVTHGTELNLGNITLKALHTPGHTLEHVSWICFDNTRSKNTPWFAFTGDSLFVGSVGRPDLLGKDIMKELAPKLYQTLFDTFFPLPDFLEILPAHSGKSLCGKAIQSRESSTIGYEKQFNPYFLKSSKEEWIHKIEEEMAPAPAYFAHLKKCNVDGPSMLSTLQTHHWDGICDLPLNDLFLIDVRHPELFAHSHIQNALNIPFTHAFAMWAGWTLPLDRPLGLFIECKTVASEAVDQLRLMGFDQEIWVIPFTEALQKKGKVIASEAFDIEELKEKLHSNAPPLLIDIRAEEEWSDGHIVGSLHIPLENIIQGKAKIPAASSIALICRTGHRASLAESFLKGKGMKHVRNVRGGLQAWKQNGYPLEQIKL